MPKAEDTRKVIDELASRYEQRSEEAHTKSVATLMHQTGKELELLVMEKKKSIDFNKAILAELTQQRKRTKELDSAIAAHKQADEQYKSATRSLQMGPAVQKKVSCTHPFLFPTNMAIV